MLEVEIFLVIFWSYMVDGKPEECVLNMSLYCYCLVDMASFSSILTKFLLSLPLSTFIR